MMCELQSHSRRLLLRATSLPFKREPQGQMSPMKGVVKEL